MDEDGTIQLRSADRRAANRGAPDDQVAVACPFEMISPILSAAVEQPGNVTRHRVRYSDSVALVAVTHRAREPQVRFDRLPAQRLRG